MRRWLVLAVLVALANFGATATAASPSITGRGHGHWHYVVSKIPDLPGHDVLHGHGTFGGTAATVSGRVVGLGFVARGHCTIKLRLTSTSGAITVRGASVKRFPGFSQCGNDFAFHYHSRKPTGSYAGESFSGRGHIVLKTAKQTTSHTRRFVVRLS